MMPGDPSDARVVDPAVNPRIAMDLIDPPVVMGPHRKGMIPTPWPVLHTARVLVEDVFDAHGNVVRGRYPAVIRYAMSLSNRLVYFSASNETFSNEYLQRVDVELHMAVHKSEVRAYSNGDQVIVGGSVEETAQGLKYVGGLAFLVAGNPNSSVTGPWPSLYKPFGGMVTLNRLN